MVGPSRGRRGHVAKQVWKGGNMLYPLPAVMVSCANAAGEKDIVTVAWAGTVCTNPPMLSISLRPERYSYHLIRESGKKGKPNYFAPKRSNLYTDGVIPPKHESGK